MGFNWTESHRAQIRARFPLEGAGKLSREWGIGHNTLRREATRLGLESNWAKTLKLNKEDLRIDAFESWSPEMAYWLGYIFADGYVQKRGGSGQLSLKCQYRDRELVTGLCFWLNSHHKIKDSWKTTALGKLRRYTMCGITSRALVDSLQNLHGVMSGKSRIGLPTLQIPDVTLEPHFVRGFFDGDGCITKAARYIDGGWTFYLLASQTFMQWMSRLIAGKAGVVLREPTLVDNPAAKTPLYRIGWADRSDVLKIRTWLYPEGVYPYLGRKRDKFNRVKGF